MTRTKLRTKLAVEAAQFINDAAGLAERECCKACVASESKLPGHDACWRFVQLAREIRKLGTKETT